jgi:glycosyltransferase involved in cell wall biosynthesis
LKSNDVIVHSEKTKADIIEMMPTVDKSKLHTIYFGPFESYTSYLDEVSPNPYGDYILFLGYLKPYKGVKYLYEAVKQMGDLRKYNFVVAGNGYDEYVEKMKADNDFIVINRYIHNPELVSLISQAKAIVCPYTNTSQSGLPQTAMVFKVPIIASNIGAFPEVIEDGVNGLLVEPSNSEALVKAFFKVQTGYSFKTKEIPPKLNWDYIASQHIDLYTKK